MVLLQIETISQKDSFSIVPILYTSIFHTVAVLYVDGKKKMTRSGHRLKYHNTDTQYAKAPPQTGKEPGGLET